MQNLDFFISHHILCFPYFSWNVEHDRFVLLYLHILYHLNNISHVQFKIHIYPFTFYSLHLTCHIIHFTWYILLYLSHVLVQIFNLMILLLCVNTKAPWRGCFHNHIMHGDMFTFIHIRLQRRIGSSPLSSQKSMKKDW